MHFFVQPHHAFFTVLDFLEPRVANEFQIQPHLDFLTYLDSACLIVPNFLDPRVAHEFQTRPLQAHCTSICGSSASGPPTASWIRRLRTPTSRTPQLVTGTSGTSNVLKSVLLIGCAARPVNSLESRKASNDWWSHSPETL